MNAKDRKNAISAISAREILDSRGLPTVEVDVWTEGGHGIASVPAGASTGIHEALELRDGDLTRYQGKGVLTAIHNINQSIAPQLNGKPVTDQRSIDEFLCKLDGTENKNKLGANAILGVSLAVAKAAANTVNQPLYQYLGGEHAQILPVPMMNVINGGLHAGNQLNIQEFMILPILDITFSEALRVGVAVYHEIRTILHKRYGPQAVNIGDEGGYAPPLTKTHEAIDILLLAIHQAGYAPGRDVFIGLDAAASSFYNPKNAVYSLDQQFYDASSLLDYYLDLVKTYPIFSLEDPFQEEDYQSHAALTHRIGGKVQLVGDDLFVTNISRLKTGIDHQACNALLLKVNQIGSLTEALDAAHYAQTQNYNVIVSHRSGETIDDYIADIAVALNCGQIKTGAPARGERVAKYNRLLKIEAQLGDQAKYAGKSILQHK
ncbi:MAG: phosphopyruvate hydratase [Candidatus Bathyarchaeota archaeon]|jgi:enolase|nr:phosphopyruvate hydratase [Candidatus Bathyarchaeota archaeon]